MDYIPVILLKKYRKRTRLSQGKLAKLLQVNQSYISEIESGKKLPSLQMLYKLGYQLNICPRQLLACKIELETCENDMGELNDDCSNI